MIMSPNVECTVPRRQQAHEGASFQSRVLQLDSPDSAGHAPIVCSTMVAGTRLRLVCSKVVPRFPPEDVVEVSCRCLQQSRQWHRVGDRHGGRPFCLRSLRTQMVDENENRRKAATTATLAPVRPFRRYFYDQPPGLRSRRHDTPAPAMLLVAYYETTFDVSVGKTVICLGIYIECWQCRQIKK